MIYFKSNATELTFLANELRFYVKEKTPQLTVAVSEDSLFDFILEITMQGCLLNGSPFGEVVETEPEADGSGRIVVDLDCAVMDAFFSKEESRVSVSVFDKGDNMYSPAEVISFQKFAGEWQVICSNPYKLYRVFTEAVFQTHTNFSPS